MHDWGRPTRPQTVRRRDRARSRPPVGPERPGPDDDQLVGGSSPLFRASLAYSARDLSAERLAATRASRWRHQRLAEASHVTRLSKWSARRISRSSVGPVACQARMCSHLVLPRVRDREQDDAARPPHEISRTRAGNRDSRASTMSFHRLETKIVRAASPSGMTGTSSRFMTASTAIAEPAD